MKEALKLLKETGEGSIEAENFIITYDKEKETDNIATFGPWSIEGDTNQLSKSQLKFLNVVTDKIRKIEDY
jgi:hypothetical protein